MAVHYRRIMAKKTSASKTAAAKAASAKKASKPARRPKASTPTAGRKSPPRKAGVRNSVMRPWTAAEITEAFSRFRAANPEPKGELEHLNPYTLLVAVALSAQATDAGVNKATRQLFPIADTPQKMLALGEDKLRDLIKTIGL